MESRSKRIGKRISGLIRNFFFNVLQIIVEPIKQIRNRTEFLLLLLFLLCGLLSTLLHARVEKFLDILVRDTLENGGNGGPIRIGDRRDGILLTELIPIARIVDFYLFPRRRNVCDGWKGFGRRSELMLIVSFLAVLAVKVHLLRRELRRSGIGSKRRRFSSLEMRWS